jgi:hypothetical protein
MVKTELYLIKEKLEKIGQRLLEAGQVGGVRRGSLGLARVIWDTQLDLIANDEELSILTP